ncbi:MAG: sensor histidine kinase, partial [Owenweeksia sp.]
KEEVLQRMKVSLRIRDFENQNKVLLEEARLNLLMAEQERSEKRWVWTTLGLIIMAALIVIILIYRNAVWQRARSREIHHRTKNFLQTLANLYDFQLRRAQDPDTKALVQESEGRVNAMLLVHNSLSGLSDVVKMPEYLKKLINAIKISFEPEIQGLDIQLSIADIQLEADRATPLALIVNELVTNSFKYGLRGLSTPVLKVSLQIQENELVLVVSDNGGKGAHSGSGSGSYGLKMVRVFARQLGGSFDLRSDTSETKAIVRVKAGSASSIS